MHYYKPGRSSLRLRDFDYRSSAIYFVTICTAQKEPWFGEIHDGKMILNENGIIAAKYWHEIPKHFPCVKLDSFVVMPNHVHGLIEICDERTRSGTTCRAATKIERHFGQNIPDSLSTIMSRYKSAVTREIGLLQGESAKLWQHNFHDHIVCDAKELRAIRKYIRENHKNGE